MIMNPIAGISSSLTICCSLFLESAITFQIILAEIFLSRKFFVQGIFLVRQTALEYSTLNVFFSPSKPSLHLMYHCWRNSSISFAYLFHHLSIHCLSLCDLLSLHLFVCVCVCLYDLLTAFSLTRLIQS